MKNTFYPERLVWDEREVRYNCLLLTPFPRNPCTPQVLSFCKSYTEFKGHIGEILIIFFLLVAASQNYVKAVHKQQTRFIHTSLLVEWTVYSSINFKRFIKVLFTFSVVLHTVLHLNYSKQQRNANFTLIKLLCV